MRRFLAVLSLGALLAAAGCGKSATQQDVSSPKVLAILAGSEVKDMEPLFPDIEKATGIHLVPTYSGTLSGIDSIESGSATPDVAWFAQDKYFGLTDTNHRIKVSQKTMISPVILGVKQSKAAELGWTDAHEPSWKDIAQAVSAGKLRYAMTSPSTSNSGFAAVISVSTAMAGSGNAVRTQDVNSKLLDSFFSGQKLISGSSGWLSDAYVQSQDQLDGMINYESLLLELNASGKLREPLHLVYPSDGVAIADYPMVLLNDAKQEAYQKVVDYLRTPEMQKKIMEETHRRPVVASVHPAPEFGNRVLVDIPFPASANAVNALLLAYLNEHRLPAHAIFVLDTSGSMEGSRLDTVKQAFHVLTGSDSSITGRFARFDDREHITIENFSDHIKDTQDFQMHRRDDPQTFAAVASYADQLSADGGTAIYDALEHAEDEAAKDGPDRYASIVLMTDGENNRGESADRFLQNFDPRTKKTRIFAIAIGEANPEELQRVATATGGRAFDARTSSLVDIFKEIRGYQ
jgi:Ca-activated chloride channel family protein